MLKNFKILEITSLAVCIILSLYFIIASFNGEFGVSAKYHLLAKEKALADEIYKINEETKIIKNRSKKFVDIVQSKEIGYDLKSGESDCGFFIFKTSKIRKILKYLIDKKMILSKKSNEVEFLSAFKYIKTLGKITTVKEKKKKDTIGINFKKDLIWKKFQ